MQKLITGGLLALFLVLAGCGSSPTWEGYSDMEKTRLQSLGLTPSEANDYRDMGFNADTIEKWYAAGFKDRRSITAWHDARFHAAEAGEWRGAGFELKTAYEWREEGFHAAEAQDWRDKGFDLKEAGELRSRGLSAD